LKINAYFKGKDAKNNFSKEDEQTTMYRDGLDELDNLSKVNLCNICVIKLKNKEWKELIKHADEALAIDHRCVKALFMKGRGLYEETEYQKAIEVY